HPAERAQCRPHERKKRWGKRSSVRARLKLNPHRTSLPSIFLANVRSLVNKMDELRLWTTTQKRIKECNVMIFTEAWLNNNIPSSAIELEGHSVSRADRSAVDSVSIRVEDQKDLARTTRCFGFFLGHQIQIPVIRPPKYKTYKITDKDSVTLPFVLNDVMGLEDRQEDGIHPNDIINVLHGHVKENYKITKHKYVARKIHNLRLHLKPPEWEHKARDTLDRKTNPLQGTITIFQKSENCPAKGAVDEPMPTKPELMPSSWAPKPWLIHGEFTREGVFGCEQKEDDRLKHCWCQVLQADVSVTSPINLFIIVIYRPPGPLGDFLEEMDTLLSVFPSDSTPLIVLGDFNLPSDKLNSSGLLALLNSFSLSFNS
ncbi:hypothetical protein QTP70_030282, partial [Hemibagrus guttatus]